MEMSGKAAYVYILTNKNHRVLYTGVTSDLQKRLWQHRNGQASESCTVRYNVNKLVWFEEGAEIALTIEREKQIKAGSRAKKVKLIESANPQWNDLAADWYG